MKQCVICCRLTIGSDLCFQHRPLTALKRAIESGARTDWPMPGNMQLVIPSHKEFQTSAHWTTGKGWDWRTQVEELMRSLYHTLDDSGWE